MAPAAKPEALPAPVPAPLVAEEDLVEIHIESPRPVRLIRRHGDNTDWYKVCHSPCDVKVPRADELMITGRGVYRSKPFHVGAEHGKRVTLFINPASKKMHRAGLLALGGAGVLALGGAVVLAAGVAPDSTFSNDGTTHNENTTAIAVGSLLLVGAVTAGITGGAWTFDNMKTKVEVEVPSRQPNREPGQPAQTGLPSPQAMAPAFAIPLFRGTF